MSWKLYDEARDPPETDIAQELDLGFSLFEPWDQRETDLTRSAAARSTTRTGTNDVDSMMLYIQALQRDGSTDIDDPAKIVPPGGQVNGGVAARTTKHNAKYFCRVPSCNKAFHQRRHLEIHLRSHTGERPYRCTYPGCDRSFSQQCNLKTHLRLHTGEKPFICALCRKSFSQKGNLTQHQLIHDSGRQFVCRLDGCEKRFTQLGNLKAHHNTSHSETLKKFTERLQGVQVPEMSPAELEMFEYFKSLYKNSNRGIRGRGKGTKNVRQQHIRDSQQFQQLPGLDRGQMGHAGLGVGTVAGTVTANMAEAPGAQLLNNQAPAPLHTQPQAQSQLQAAVAPAPSSYPVSSWNFPGANLLIPTHLASQMNRSQPDQAFPPMPQQPSIKRLLNQSEDSALPPFYVMERWKP